jgi:hypothetical protein
MREVQGYEALSRRRPATAHKLHCRYARVPANSTIRLERAVERWPPRESIPVSKQQLS